MLINKVSVGVMLDVKTIPRLVPIIKELTSQYMTTNTPRGGVTFSLKFLVGTELVKASRERGPLDPVIEFRFLPHDQHQIPRKQNGEFVEPLSL